MKVVINQSNYIPWKGYFDLIHDADLMIFLDDVQYTTRDWRNRNRIKTQNGLKWLTIPCGSSRSWLVSDVLLPQEEGWNTEHWRSIVQSYREAPHFRDFEEFFADIFGRIRWKTLSEFNQYLTRAISTDILGIRTEFVSSAEFGVTSRKQERIIDLLTAVGATTYISGPAARAYLDPERFHQAGVELLWKDYSGYPEYGQLYPPFEHAVTVLDLLFHTGATAADYVWGWRERPA